MSKFHIECSIKTVHRLYANYLNYKQCNWVYTWMYIFSIEFRRFQTLCIYFVCKPVRYFRGEDSSSDFVDAETNMLTSLANLLHPRYEKGTLHDSEKAKRSYDSLIQLVVEEATFKCVHEMQTQATNYPCPLVLPYIPTDFFARNAKVYDTADLEAKKLGKNRH